jgi:hypothetical protein
MLSFDVLSHLDWARLERFSNVDDADLKSNHCFDVLD